MNHELWVSTLYSLVQFGIFHTYKTVSKLSTSGKDWKMCSQLQTTSLLENTDTVGTVLRLESRLDKPPSHSLSSTNTIGKPYKKIFKKTYSKAGFI